MAIIPAPPADINECGVLKILRAKSSPADGVAARVEQFMSVAAPMLDLIAVGPFRNFTLHNRDHAKKLLHLIDHLVPPSTMEKFSVLECLFLVYAVFLHDMGMSLTSSERERILASSDFQDTLRDWPEVNTAIEQTRHRLPHLDDGARLAAETVIFQLQEAALCAYLRPRHATPERYRQLFAHLTRTANIPDLFAFRGVSFENWLIDICASHNLDASVLSDSSSAYEDRFPRDLTIAQYRINTQFCAALLRLADILDFDRERTPPILFESLGIASLTIPGGEVSLREWEKHMSVHSLDIRPDEIVVSAECHHPVIEKATREFCVLIEKELRETIATLKRNPPHILERYAMDLPQTVRARIHSIGYSYRDVSLRLNQSSIISLLMGDRLYSHPGVALRELVQNSLDACDVRRRIESDESYTPTIEVNATEGDDGRRWISVNDNGMGMDEHVLSEYFLKLGDSYYRSTEFKRLFAKTRHNNEPFNPISRFGIGIVSVFMLADVLEVRTRSAFSPRGDQRARLLRIERLGGLAFVTDCERTSVGTEVRIRLRQDVETRFATFADEAANYLRWLLVRPWYLIRISLGPRNQFYAPDPRRARYLIDPDSKEKLRALGYEALVIDVSRWSEKLSGLIAILFARADDDSLHVRRDGRRVTFRESEAVGVDPKILIPDYAGNRLTVNGFNVRGFRTSRILRFKSGIRLSLLADVDIRGGDEVEFDVSRERLTAVGDAFVKQEIQTAVLRALAETGTLDRLAAEVRLQINIIPRDPQQTRARMMPEKQRPDALRYLLQAVVDEIPKDVWPKGMHHDIARKLGISSTLVSRSIVALMKAGVVVKPGRDANANAGKTVPR